MSPATRRSGPRAMSAVTGASISRRVSSTSFVTSQSRIVLSRAPEASRPSGSRQRAATARGMTLEAGGLGPGRHVPEPDRVVIGARGEPPVRQQAKGGDRAGMTLEAGGLGPGRHVPEPDRVVIGARGEPPVRQQAKGGDRAGMTLEAGGLGPGRHVPEPDRVVLGARGEPPVRQQAKGGTGAE